MNEVNTFGSDGGAGAFLKGGLFTASETVEVPIGGGRLGGGGLGNPPCGRGGRSGNDHQSAAVGSEPENTCV